jgi:uncharacterized NAD-dependent epimerase/dehydratase family protein
MGLRRYPDISIPPLRAYIDLCEDVGEVCGTYPRPKTIGIALNTAHMPEDEARLAVESTARESGLPCTDPVRFGAAPLVQALLAE